MWQDMHPGKIVSYKADVMPPGERAAVVCFHGVPKPHEVKDGFVMEHWR